MAEMKAFDLGRYQRLVGVSGGRISGDFAVLLSPHEGRESWVTAHNVVIYDEGHNSGRVLHSGDLTGNVKGGVAEISRHMVNQKLLADVEDVWVEMLAVLVACVEAAQAAVAPVEATDV